MRHMRRFLLVTAAGVAALALAGGASAAAPRFALFDLHTSLADASHNAMHQPAGPEVVPPATKLA